MSRNSIKITDTLMLRRIDPVSMIKGYLAGDFKKLGMPQTKVTMSSAFVNLGQRVGTDSSSEIYRFNDKTNQGQLIITTNHEQYKHAKEQSEGKNTEPSVVNCKWCNRLIKGPTLGIPISMSVNKHTSEVRFNIIDFHHSFECALATLKRRYSTFRMYKDPLLMDAEQMLHCMYYKMHPKKKGTRIREALDPDLLVNNNGPLTEDEWESDQHTYISVPNVVLVPVKKQYIKLTLGKK